MSKCDASRSVKSLVSPATPDLPLRPAFGGLATRVGRTPPSQLSHGDSTPERGHRTTWLGVHRPELPRPPTRPEHIINCFKQLSLGGQLVTQPMLTDTLSVFLHYPWLLPSVKGINVSMWARGPFPPSMLPPGAQQPHTSPPRGHDGVNSQHTSIPKRREQDRTPT